MIPSVKTDNIVTWNQSCFLQVISSPALIGTRNLEIQSIHMPATAIYCAHTHTHTHTHTHRVKVTVPFCSPSFNTSRIYTKSGFHRRLNWKVLLCQVVNNYDVSRNRIPSFSGWTTLPVGTVTRTWSFESSSTTLLEPPISHTSYCTVFQYMWIVWPSHWPRNRNHKI